MPIDTMPNVTLKADAKDKLLAARRFHTWSVGYVAQQAGVSEAWVYRAETGKLSARESELQCVCAVLKLDWLELIETTRPLTKRRGVTKKPLTIPNEPATEIEPDANDSFVDMFFAVPMDALGDEYGASRSDVLSLLDDIRKKFGASKVFCAVEGRVNEGDFDDEAIALRSNLAVLRYSTCLLAIVPSRVVTSVLVEVGAAIAFGKPVVLFARNSSDLPFLLRKTARDPSLTVIQYKSAKDLRKLLPEAMRILKPKTGWLSPDVE